MTPQSHHSFVLLRLGAAAAMASPVASAAPEVGGSLYLVGSVPELHRRRLGEYVLRQGQLLNGRNTYAKRGEVSTLMWYCSGTGWVCWSFEPPVPDEVGG